MGMHEISSRPNVFREIGRTDPDANVAGWLHGINDAELAISALTVREVRKGIVKLRARKPSIADEINARIAEAFAAFGKRVLPVTREIADLWGALLGQAKSTWMILASPQRQGFTGSSWSRATSGMSRVGAWRR